MRSAASSSPTARSPGRTRSGWPGARSWSRSGEARLSCRRLQRQGVGLAVFEVKIDLAPARRRGLGQGFRPGVARARIAAGGVLDARGVGPSCRAATGSSPRRLRRTAASRRCCPDRSAIPILGLARGFTTGSPASSPGVVSRPSRPSPARAGPRRASSSSSCRFEPDRSRSQLSNGSPPRRPGCRPRSGVGRELAAMTTPSISLADGGVVLEIEEARSRRRAPVRESHQTRREDRCA